MIRTLPSRRTFIKAALAATATTLPEHARLYGAPAPSAGDRSTAGTLRAPDRIFASYDTKDLLSMQRAGDAWTLRGVHLSVFAATQHGHQELQVRLSSSTRGLTALRLRWERRSSEQVLSLGDQWERAYGDLEWRGVIPNRVMPWYFLSLEGDRVTGYGVKTQPAAFCFWQRDASGITLSIDLKNGGNAADLRGRNLDLCTIVGYEGGRSESIFDVNQAFCKRMCPAPKLPEQPLFGLNDWNYAYGRNTASGILRDADLIAALAPDGPARPYIVVDDGWQDKSRFPDMRLLGVQIAKRNLHPGLWIRPLRAQAGTPRQLLLPPERFGRSISQRALAFDPTVPEALAEIEKSVTGPSDWGYIFLKHDFSTFDLFGRWGSQMEDQISAPGWSFADHSRTNAEIVAGLYRAIRRAAGEKRTLLGCNTVGHIAAGVFESQRIGDDTSGRDWERTRRFGVNALAHRVAQHKTFSYIDPDCVAVTKDVGWKETSQWMDVVARTGTSLFVSPAPDAVRPEVKAAIKQSMASVVEQSRGWPTCPTSGTTPEAWTFQGGLSKTYEWTSMDKVSPASEV